MKYACSCCGQIHDGLPDLTFDKPGYVNSIPDSEQKQRVRINEDLCVVDEEHYFIRGVIKIPVLDHDEDLGFGVWVSQKKENFEKYLENFDTKDIGPFFGWLSNEFKYGGESTTNLKTMAYFYGNGLRPLIELEESDHPLSLAQRHGISLDEAWRIIHQFLD